MTTLLLSIIGAFIATLILERAPSISRWLITRSADQLRVGDRKTRRDQWLADNEDVIGSAWKLIHALGCSWLCRIAITQSIRRALRSAVRRKKVAERPDKPRISVTLNPQQLARLDIIHEKIKPSNRPPLLLRLPDEGWRIDGLSDEEHQLCRKVLAGYTLEDAAADAGRPLEEIQTLADDIAAKTGFPSFAHFCVQLSILGVEDDE